MSIDRFKVVSDISSPRRQAIGDMRSRVAISE
jgi:hypothetical protein